MMKKAGENLLRLFSLYRNRTTHEDVKNFYILSDSEKYRATFYQQFIKPGDVVFDVGANMGNRIKIFIALGAKVVAFEPQKICSDFLKIVLKKNHNFTLVEEALGDQDGNAEMLISNAHTISTLSQHWIKATKESGRFSQYTWNKKQHVHVTTLDNAIEKYGMPSFIKIDVEGYESKVLAGLTKPIQFISIEFAAENIEDTYKCIEYISSLSNVSFQFSKGESMDLDLPTWVSKDDIKRILANICDQDRLAWGDVYIKNS